MRATVPPAAPTTERRSTCPEADPDTATLVSSFTAVFTSLTYKWANMTVEYERRIIFKLR